MSSNISHTQAQLKTGIKSTWGALERLNKEGFNFLDTHEGKNTNIIFVIQCLVKKN